VKVQHGLCWASFPYIVIEGQLPYGPQKVEIVLVTLIDDTRQQPVPEVGFDISFSIASPEHQHFDGTILLFHCCVMVFGDGLDERE
jgi:hypothetical protein